MRTLVLANYKGGVGKSAMCCQLAYYFAEKLGKRVLVIDLDAQRSTSKSLRKSDLVSVSDTVASQLFEDPSCKVQGGPFVLVTADDQVKRLEKQGTRRDAFAGNFRSFVQRAGGDFDVCLIDTHPADDVRLAAALIAATHVLAIIQFSQESLDGVGDFLNAVEKITTHFNPNLQLIGILPSMVEATPYQRSIAAEVFKRHARRLISLPVGGFAQIKRSQAMAEAQGKGEPLWKGVKTSSRDFWRASEPSFKHIADKMEIPA